MAHTDLNTFLIQEFKGNEDGNYGRLPMSRKRDLQRHLHSILKNEPQRILPKFEEDPGVKLHFKVSRGSRGWESIPNKTFMKKMAFVADKSLITFPFHDVDYSKDEDLQCLLQLIESIYPFIDKNIFYVLPSYDTNQDISLTTDKFDNDYGLISANFRYRPLLVHFKEEVVDQANVLEPEFSKISTDEIIMIREENKTRYQYMQRCIGGAFIEASDFDKRMLKELVEIDKNVKKLTVKFDNLKSTYTSESLFSLGKIAFTLLRLVARHCPFSALIASVVDDEKPLSSIAGAVKGVVKHRQDIRSFMDEDFYLYWRIQHPKATI